MSSYLWGLIQKIRFFFKRDSAKFVPMLNVAGKAGGTTIVTKSKARTMIRCNANCKDQFCLQEKEYLDPHQVERSLQRK